MGGGGGTVPIAKCNIKTVGHSLFLVIVGLPRKFYIKKKGKKDGPPPLGKKVLKKITTILTFYFFLKRGGGVVEKNKNSAHYPHPHTLMRR